MTKTYTKQECADLLGITYSRVKTLQNDLKQSADSQKYFREARNGYSLTESGLQQLRAMISDHDIETVTPNSQETVNKQELDSLRKQLETIKADHAKEISELKAAQARELLEIQSEHSKRLEEMNSKLLEQMNRLTLINVKQLQSDHETEPQRRLGLIERIKGAFSKKGS